MTEDMLLAATDLTRSYGRIRAVDGVQLQVGRGETLGLLGLNGAGKSTTLQILAGALSANRGRVSICGHDLAGDGRAARRLIGYLPQTPPLYDDMEVAEYLNFIARIQGVARSGLSDTVQRATARCGLSDVVGRLIRHLSQGYQQRVGIAQAVLHEPAVLLLDEPTNGLDPAQIRDVRELITSLAPQRATIVSTHILSEVRMLATRIVIMHEGRVVHDAPNGSALDTLRVSFAHQPQVEALTAIDGVVAAEWHEQGYWLLRCDEDCSPRVAECAVRAGWGIAEMIKNYDALEHLFLRLTAGDSVVAAA